MSCATYLESANAMDPDSDPLNRLFCPLPGSHVFLAFNLSLYCLFVVARDFRYWNLLCAFAFVAGKILSASNRRLSRILRLNPCFFHLHFLGRYAQFVYDSFGPLLS